MAKSTVAVRFTGDTADLKRSLDNVDSKLKSTGSKLASFGKVAAIGLGGLAVGGAALAKGFVEAAVESQKVTKQTEAVIKSMGGAANVTARQVGKLSTELSLQTGIDDELIQSGENILLTFGNIRNEVGEGNDIFNQATEAALDMSVALGTDMKSASMQLGKALNDPVAGLNKLKRSGIQFTKQQEDQIKAMVEVGDVAGAQKVMLAELSRQFGGSAEAQATAQDKLKVAWGNLQEQLGEKLLPIVERLATWLADHLPAAMDAVSRSFQRAKPFLEDVAEAVKEFVTDALEVMREWWNDNGDKVIAAAEALAAGVKKAFDALISAGKFVIDHWDQFQVLAGAMVTLVIGHYVRLAAQATIHTATVIAQWVKTEAAAIKAAVTTGAQVAIQIAKWAWLAARATVHAAVVAAQWLISTAKSTVATAATIAAATAQEGAWAGMAVAAETSSARIGRAWLGVLGPAAAVIAAAEAINNLTGNKANPAGKSLIERLNPFHGLHGIDIGLSNPFGHASGTRSSPGGLRWVGEHGKELVKLPQGSQVFSHTRSMAMTTGGGSGPQIIQVVLDGRVLGEVLANRATVDNRNRAA